MVLQQHEEEDRRDLLNDQDWWDRHSQQQQAAPAENSLPFQQPLQPLQLQPSSMDWQPMVQCSQAPAFQADRRPAPDGQLPATKRPKWS